MKVDGSVVNGQSLQKIYEGCVSCVAAVGNIQQREEPLVTAPSTQARTQRLFILCRSQEYNVSGVQQPTAPFL
jgi:hypothetical protein